MSSGGGGPKETTQNVNQSSVPKELMPYAMQMLGQGQALTNIANNPYQQYQGQRIADISPLQSQAFQSYAGMQPSEQTQQATGMAGLAGLGGLNNQTFGQEQASAYMSPYMQNVVDVQQRKAREAANMASTQRQANAATSGAYTGNRAAIQDAMARRDLGYQLGDIQAQGLQSAYTNAQQQFNSDQAQRMQGLGIAGQAASTLGGLGQQQYEQGMGIADAQMRAGEALQQQQQQGLTQQYQDFLNQQQYPYQQLAFMNALIHGTPTTDTMTTMYQAPGNQAGQYAGLLGGLGSLFMSGSGGKS